MKNTKSMNVKTVILVAFACVCILIPVWQSAVCSQLEAKISSTQSRIARISEETMTVNASISTKTTPEYLYAMAVNENISFSLVASK